MRHAETCFTLRHATNPSCLPFNLRGAAQARRIPTCRSIKLEISAIASSRGGESSHETSVRVRARSVLAAIAIPTGVFEPALCGQAREESAVYGWKRARMLEERAMYGWKTERGCKEYERGMGSAHADQRMGSLSEIKRDPCRSEINCVAAGAVRGQKLFTTARTEALTCKDDGGSDDRLGLHLPVGPR